MRETPTGSGVLIAGRSQFFDSERELHSALGIQDSDSPFIRLSLAEMSDSQALELLRQHAWKGAIPEWLPTRPLLLSYLAANGLLVSPDRPAEMRLSPAEGWHNLLDRISAREAEIEAGIDAHTVRRIIESLATTARTTATGLGPISSDTIVESFKQICGFVPDDRATVLLQRLPGLGPASSEDGSRVFVDLDLVEAAKAGSVFHFIQDPYSGVSSSDRWLSSMRSLGAEVAALRCQEQGFDAGKVSAALRVANQRGTDVLAVDTCLTLGAMDLDYTGGRVFSQGDGL